VKLVSKVDRQDDVGAPPGLIADDPPAMAAAGGVLSKQHVSRTNEEGLPGAGLELERPAQGQDELAGAMCHASASSGLVSLNEIDAAVIARPIASPSCPSGSDKDPSSKAEYSFESAQILTQRNIRDLQDTFRVEA
jgi:hypothetical protein